MTDAADKMLYIGEYRVSVTKHAYDRACERFPGFAGRPSSDVSPVIRREVREAIEAGRRSSSEPSWINPASRLRSGEERHRRTKRTRASRSRQQGTLRYFWTEDKERIYRCLRAVENGVVVWVVLTVYRKMADLRRQAS